MLEGPRFVRDAIVRGIEPVAVAMREGSSAELDPGDWTRLDVSSDVFDVLGSTATMQGVSGLFRKPVLSLESIDPGNGPLVVLDGVQDPGNVGTIVRLAAAFEAGPVITMPGSADPWGPRSLRASAGAMLDVKAIRSTASELLAWLRQRGIPLYAADGSGRGDLTLPRRAAVVFGSEGSGVSPELLEASERIAVPTSGRVESLNVAAAAAILLSNSWNLASRSL